MKIRNAKKIIKKLGITPELALDVIAEYVKENQLITVFIDTAYSWPHYALHSADRSFFVKSSVAR